MIKVPCPKCSHSVDIDIKKAVDEHGEVFICPNCKFKFRYAPNG